MPGKKQMDDEAAIRALLDRRAEANRIKDADAAVRLYAENAVNFDLAPPLAQRGKEVKDPSGLREWFATWKGPIDVELKDVEVSVESDIAFAHGFLHMQGDRTDGSHTDVWARSTVCLRRDGAEWEIVHEHTSFPMRMDGSEKAATTLKPDT